MIWPSTLDDMAVSRLDFAEQYHRMGDEQHQLSRVHIIRPLVRSITNYRHFRERKPPILMYGLGEFTDDGICCTDAFPT